MMVMMIAPMLCHLLIVLIVIIYTLQQTKRKRIHKMSELLLPINLLLPRQTKAKKRFMSTKEIQDILLEKRQKLKAERKLNRQLVRLMFGKQSKFK